MPPSTSSPRNNALSEAHLATPSYLIKGDISGIQDFIFNVKSDGAAQSLKGRSFFIKILLKVGMQLIFDELDITDEEEIAQSKISTSGGNFILEIQKPNLEIIEKVQGILTTSLQFTKLNLIISAVPMQQDKYMDTLKALNLETRKRKYQLFHNSYSLFGLIERKDIQSITSNKKWEKVTSEIRTKTHFDIKKIEKPKSLLLSIKENEKVMSIEFAGYNITFGNSGIELIKHLESIIPIDIFKGREQTMQFQELVKSDSRRFGKRGGLQGVNKLGVLAMDVDNLGFALEGVEDRIKHKEFDDKLKKFFNDKVRTIIETYKNQTERNGKQLRHDSHPDKYNNRIYTVTAGGDDSYFVGKWNTLLDLSIDIREAFLKEFSAQELTISAALVIVNEKFPVVRFAQLADDAIKDAKYKYENQKGNINLFGEVLDWDILLKEIMPLRKEFNKRGKSEISSGLLAKARSTATKIADDKGLRLSDLWKMGYFLRNFSNGGKIVNQHRNHLTKSLTEKNKLKSRSLRMVFPVAARLAEFDNRNK